MDLPPGLRLRALELDDYHKGYVQLLSQLTAVEPLSEADFKGRFQELARLGEDVANIVLEDEVTNKVVAAGTLVVIRKFIRSCSKAGYIEEIVVDKGQRGRHLGQKIIQHLVGVAQQAGCYKVILSCEDANVGFYEKCSFQRKGAYMHCGSKWMSSFKSFGNVMVLGHL